MRASLLPGPSSLPHYATIPVSSHISNRPTSAQLNPVCHPQVFQGTITDTEQHMPSKKAAMLKDRVLQSGRSDDQESFCPLKRKRKKKSNAQSGGIGETSVKSIQEENRRVHHQPCQHVPNALTSGEKASWAHTEEHRFLPQDPTLLCSHPALHPSTALPARTVPRWFKQDYCTRTSPRLCAASSIHPFPGKL